MRLAARLFALLVAVAGCSGDEDSQLVVFAASSLTEAAEELIATGPADGIGSVELVLGGSASLAAQIRDGAPADVFMSADRRWADQVAATCASPCPIHPFATNTLILAVPAGNRAGISGLEDLSRSELLVVLCASEVPCGQLGERVTSMHGVTPAVDSFESSVRAVRTRLELNEADVGLIYATDVSDGVEVIPDQRIDQHETTYFYVVLDTEPGSEVLTEHISGPSGQRVLERMGFGSVTS